MYYIVYNLGVITFRDKKLLFEMKLSISINIEYSLHF